jgi:hypothetical protein
MKKTGLTKWFDEEWVDLSRPIYDEDGELIGFEPCGRKRATSQQATRDYPKCRPLATAMSMSEEERKSAIYRKRRAEVPFTSGRARPPVMVQTFRENPRRRNPVSGLAQVFGPLYIRVRKCFPEIEARFVLSYDADVGPRSFAYCQEEADGSFSICVAPKLAHQSRHRIEGLFAHELGHAVLMHMGEHEHTERDADNAAEQVFGFRIFYDEDDVQSTRYGVRPRPEYLDDEDGFTCVS